MRRRFTDIFICRPVLAIVVSLLILILGLKSLIDLPIRQYPRVENTLITIQTAYPGAPPGLIEGFITQQIERSVATAEGIDYLDSSSSDGRSLINVHVKLNYSPDAAFTDVMSKVAQVQNILPKQAQLPVIEKKSDASTSLMFIAYDSKMMSAEQITSYIRRVVQPKLETVDGVASAQILGGKTLAMRIWLDTQKMASLDITSADVERVLLANNFQSAAGKIKGYFLQLSLTANTDAVDVKSFENMVIKRHQGALVRLKDIARVKLGSETYDSSVYLNGNKAVFVAINATPTANPIDVIHQVKALLPGMASAYPPTLTSEVVHDVTTYIQASMYEVIKTIVEAALIVILVISLFLASIRAVIIPVVTIPLSIIGVIFCMLIMGYSINLLTLLAMVLSIGLVVDDAIVVVENVYRHIEAGVEPFQAAIRGTREIASAIVAMTITLAAVYAPIGFMTGLTGALFKEFAFTLAGAVIVSGVIALTLSPMMCSRLLVSSTETSAFVQRVDRFFDRLKHGYKKSLANVLNYKTLIVVMAGVVLSSCFILYINTPSELAPNEDQGVLLAVGTGPEYANIHYVERNTSYMQQLIENFPSQKNFFVVNGMNGSNTMFAGVLLKPWQMRESQFKIQPKLQRAMQTVPGLRTVIFPISPLPGSGSGLPVQFVLTTVGDFQSLYAVAEKLREAALKSGLFIFVNNSLKYNKPETMINIDRNMARSLGIEMQDISSALSRAYGGSYVNRFPMMGQSYKVIPQVSQRFRLTPESIRDLNIRTASGELVPLATFATLQQNTKPNALTHFQQLNSATIGGVLMPGVSMGEALTYLEGEAKKYMPTEMTYNYAGQLRQYVKEGSDLMITLFLSLVVIFLVLSAQFESFRDPLVILVSVPMSICGALFFLNVFSTWSNALTINIYTQIGLITLVGLISKHGILIVQFANQLRSNKGLSVRDAVLESASTRLRPILMTTAATALGVLPLLFASGAGAQSRLAIGVVIFTGMLIGTLFTLFVVPTLYLLITRRHRVVISADHLQ